MGLPTLSIRHPDECIDDGAYLCRFDDTRHADLDALHAHIRRFKVSREKYYHQYHPRKDPVTGELIPFKDLDQYLSQDFASKVTLKKWLAAHPAEGLQWATDWLAKRKVIKSLVYAPSQAELRTLCCPSMPYYDAFAEGGYYGLTRSLGYADRYNADPLTFTLLPSDTVVIRDTREQTPIHVAAATRKKTLNVGDYALAAPHDLGIRIERKSLSDFCGTLSGRKQTREGKTKTTEWSNLERFDRELTRAEAAGLYVVMMVEASITDAQRFPYLPQTQWVKASPEYIFHNLRDLLAKHPLTFQVVFADGRIEAARLIKRVFELGAQVKTTDLQYALETKRL